MFFKLIQPITLTPLAVKLLLLFTLILSQPISAASNTTQLTIKIPLLDWSSQRVISLAIGEQLKQYGYSVEFVSMSEKNLWGALIRGKVHFQTSVWQAASGETFQQMLDNKRIDSLGTHTALSREDWWYPDYVAELCPGLPSWQALNNCANLFSASAQAQEDSHKGIYLTGPWSYRDADLIRSLSLNFVPKRHESMNQVWQALAAARASKQPIVLLNWMPNWTDNRLSGKFVQFPAYTPECETDPSWGLNPQLAFDCGNVPNGWIKKAAWKGLKKQAPCVHQFISNLDFDNSMISEAAALVDYDRHSEPKAAQLWQQKYRHKLLAWSTNSCINKE